VAEKIAKNILDASFNEDDFSGPDRPTIHFIYQSWSLLYRDFLKLEDSISKKRDKKDVDTKETIPMKIQCISQL